VFSAERCAFKQTFVRYSFGNVVIASLSKARKFDTPMSHQKLILTDPCITRAERAVRGVPKVALV